MRAIHRKLVRDLKRPRGQVLAIVFVLMAGVAMFVAYFSTFDSLRHTRETYYTEARFADVFAQARRAPLSVASELARIDGVGSVETRVVVDVTLDLQGVAE